MHEPFYIIAKLQPVPGKAQETINILQPFTEHVKATEPGCLQYEMFQPEATDADMGLSSWLSCKCWVPCCSRFPDAMMVDEREG